MPGIKGYPSGNGVAIVLVARSAIAAAPRAEMERLAAHAAGLPGIAFATHAFTEQGLPSLRTVVGDLRRQGFDEIRLVPLLLPMEPSFRAWMARTLSRWQSGDDGPWPEVRIGPGPEASGLTTLLVADLIAGAAEAPALDRPAAATVTGSVVAAAGRRVLLCQGGPCNEAGAGVLWGHLRNEQERLGLRTAGRGTMSARTSCLGPCSLAPVVQVWPEGTVYGGVNEAGIDRIVAEHLVGDIPVEELAYPADGRKQAVRRPS